MKKSLDYIEKGLKRFYRRIISNTSLSVEEISFYRIFLGVFTLIFRPSFSWLENIPQGFYRPNILTTAYLFKDFPANPYFQITDILIVVLLLFIILGIKSRTSCFALFFILIINNSFIYSFGKIDHSIFTPLIFLYFAFTNAGTKYAVLKDKKIKTQDIATAVFAIFLGFAFFTAGFEKALHWIDFDLRTSGVSSWFYSGYFTLDRNRLLADYFFYIPTWLKEAMDYTAVIFEVSGLIFLFYRRKTWLLYLLMASIFHLTNSLILNISFLNNLPMYGLWLLAPMLLKNKQAIFILTLSFFFKGIYLVALMWALTIISSLFGYFNGNYEEKNVPVNIQ